MVKKEAHAAHARRQPLKLNRGESRIHRSAVFAGCLQQTLPLWPPCADFWKYDLIVYCSFRCREGLRERWEKNLRDPSKVLVTPELIQNLIDEGRLKDTPQLWENLKLERPREKVPSVGKVQLPTQRFKRK